MSELKLTHPMGDMPTSIYVTSYPGLPTVRFNMHFETPDGYEVVQEAGMQSPTMYKSGSRVKYTGIEILAKSVKMAQREGRLSILNHVPRKAIKQYQQGMVDGKAVPQPRELNFQEYSALMEKLGVEGKLAA